ncbi:hypothetical protein LFWB_6140 [Candidatus Phytoplasma luffae]|uniref:DUF4064 domain-containing protein n=1 Tax=Loofah witches'-broom phytoplasma TaxID=35773 RepID=A0A975FJP9_LOWBP|nr:hypothetical protein [Candidatus Phytoplasma luffae]QTX03177.1 hypothetical protein LFWB_6140 [Candidatus Phytoplasma luffae]
MYNNNQYKNKPNYNNRSKFPSNALYKADGFVKTGCVFGIIGCILSSILLFSSLIISNFMTEQEFFINIKEISIGFNILLLIFLALSITLLILFIRIFKGQASPTTKMVIGMFCCLGGGFVGILILAGKYEPKVSKSI